MKTNVTVAILLLCSTAAHGQTFAGSDRENYLRYVQTEGAAPVYPWGVRAFSPAELRWLSPGDTARPWFAATARFNSTFPYGYNDGAIWAGKGVTLALDGGFMLRRGVLSLTVAPLACGAPNAPVP